MKKFLTFIAAVAALAVSCNEKKDEPVSPENIVPDKKGELYDAEQAKGKIQDAAVVALELVNPDDFKALSDLVSFVREEIMSSEIENVAEWLSDAAEKVGGAHSSNDERTEGDKIYRTYSYESIWMLSLAPFNGKYTLKDGKWTIEDAKNLVVIVPDAAGKDCILTIDKSSKESTINFADFIDIREDSYEDWIGWDPYTYENIYGMVYETDTNVNKIDVVLPEEVKLTLVDDGKTMISAEIKSSSDVKGLIFPDYCPDNEVLGKSVLNITSKVDVAGYVFNCERLKFDKGDAAVTVKVQKGDKDAVTLTATTSGISFSRETRKEEYADYEYTRVDCDKINIGADLMGSVQVSGSIDAVPMSEATNNFYDAVYEGKSEKECFAFIDEANTYMDLGVYLGSKTRQASVIIEGVIEDDSYWGKEGDIVTALKFEDKSKYSLEEYFNDKDFRRVIGVYDDLVDELMKLVPEFMLSESGESY